MAYQTRIEWLTDEWPTANGTLDYAQGAWDQSRTQSPQAPWSAVLSPGETLGKWNYFP